uniref:DDE_Tnp_IS1595 domain-containing protein n=1 Tax=Echinostoma caproni TaxID=27848 RepID=A0A183B465_9TREM
LHRSGSIIISDMWASYQGIETMIDMNYIHETVNHFENFVDLTTGVHTQTNESLCHIYKMQNESQCGTNRSLVKAQVPKKGHFRANY